MGIRMSRVVAVALAQGTALRFLDLLAEHDVPTLRPGLVENRVRALPPSHYSGI